jgi:hypothetical protein
MRFYEDYDYHTKKKHWWTQRDAEGRCADIRRNDNGGFNLLVCDIFKSEHKTLQEAMEESKNYVNGIICGVIRY